MIEIFPDDASEGLAQAGGQAAEHPAAHVDLWTWSLDGSPEEAARTSAHLTREELARADRFATETLASRWIVARGRTREILAGYLGRAPSELAFELGPQGKPFLRPVQGRELHFNLSHSHDRAGLAVSRDLTPGFDLERWMTAPFEVAADVFSAAERAELDSYAGEAKHAAFYRGWTRKEAFIKALGMGLSFPLNRVDVSFSRNDPRILRIDGMAAADWRLVGIEDQGCWIAALAVPRPAGAMKVRLRSPGDGFEELC